MTSEQNIAVGGARVMSVSADRYDQVMRELPKRIRYFMLYSAASSFSEEAVLQYFYRYGEKATLEKLQYDQDRETSVLFGPGHPELEGDNVWNKKWSWPRAGIHKPLGRRARFMNNTLTVGRSPSTEPHFNSSGSSTSNTVLTASSGQPIRTSE